MWAGVTFCGNAACWGLPSALLLAQGGQDSFWEGHKRRLCSELPHSEHRPACVSGSSNALRLRATLLHRLGSQPAQLWASSPTLE